ncbi:unnamed protein product, partial [Ectocarpus sp. 12 AP-2014]
DGLETYDVDYKTGSVRISGDFSSPGQSISISEVEFVEEVVDGEVLLETSYFDDYDWNDATTDEATEEALYYDLAGYFTVSEMQLLFPA